MKRQGIMTGTVTGRFLEAMRRAPGGQLDELVLC